MSNEEFCDESTANAARLLAPGEQRERRFGGELAGSLKDLLCFLCARGACLVSPEVHPWISKEVTVSGERSQRTRWS